jgi:hypothetical protein
MGSGRGSLCVIKWRREFQGFGGKNWRDATRSALRVVALCAIAAALGMLGCGTRHATLVFTAPSAVGANTPFTVTVTVLYDGNPDRVINSPIHFTSSDPAAILPGNYYFTPSDAGSHTWTNGFTLVTPGTQTVSGYIYFNASQTKSGINGSATIVVSP